jgi:hypothetical protein
MRSIVQASFDTLAAKGSGEAEVGQLKALFERELSSEESSYVAVWGHEIAPKIILPM